jgi:hypothetical protein
MYALCRTRDGGYKRIPYYDAYDLIDTIMRDDLTIITVV